MVERVERVTQSTEPIDRNAQKTRVVQEVAEERPGAATLIARIIWYITGVLLVLLAFRFLLALLGANPSNGFANFIYAASHPFVAPFFSLFGYHLQYGVSRVELYTLVAMAVYALIGYGLSRLAEIGRPHHAAPMTY